MAKKLTSDKIEKTKTDFDPPEKIPTSAAVVTTPKKKKSLSEQIEEREKKAPQKKKSLREQIEEREEKAAEITTPKKPVVTKIAGDERNDKRSKTLSLRVYNDIHNDFTKINRRRGMSTNSVLNMLITQYIRDNRDLLDDN